MKHIIQQLESDRIKWLACLIAGFFVVFGIIFYLYFFLHSHEILWYAILILSYISIAVFICSDFEYRVKRSVLNDVIENIIKDRGDIFWSGNLSNIRTNFQNRNFGRENDFFGNFIRTNSNANNFLNYFPGVREFGFCDSRWRLHVRHGDIFHGVYDDNKFIAAEVVISERRRYYNRYYSNYNYRRGYFPRTHEQSRTLFRGFIIEIETDKHYDMGLMVRGHRWISNLPGFRRVDAGQTPFGKKYDVFVQNQSLNLRIPSKLPQYIMNFNKNTSIGLIDNRIVFMLETGRNLFQFGSIFKKINDSKQYKKFLNDFVFMLSIVSNLPKVVNDEEI